MADMAYLTSRLAEHRFDATHTCILSHEKVFSFLITLENNRLDLFFHLFDAVSRRFPDKEPRYIGQYTSLPKGYSGKGLINFADYYDGGVARPHSWAARIVLTDKQSSPLTVILPDPPSRDFHYCEQEALKGGNSFAVSNIDAFLRAARAGAASYS